MSACNRILECLPNFRSHPIYLIARDYKRLGGEGRAISGAFKNNFCGIAEEDDRAHPQAKPALTRSPGKEKVHYELTAINKSIHSGLGAKNDRKTALENGCRG